MIEFNISNVTGDKVQIGKNNNMNFTKSLGAIDEELLRLINKHSPTKEQKIELINDLQIINEESIKSPESARKLLSFVKGVGINLVSTALVKSLEIISG